jgi:hypothetical protein
MDYRLKLSKFKAINLILDLFINAPFEILNQGNQGTRDLFILTTITVLVYFYSTKETRKQITNNNRNLSWPDLQG